MQIAQIIGGYTLGAADMLRRAMGKKKPEEMAKHRGIFIEGALKKGYTEELATKLFDLMAMFAEYGFNKSHTAAYAVVTYQTAWLKAHYPSAFMAATLSSELDDTDKVHVFYQDCLLNGLEVLPPDINASEYRFMPVDARRIRYGLGAVKGTGEAAIDAIVAARQADGPFKDLFDLCRRVDKRIVNRRVLESLIRAGAFDSLNDHRASLLASVGVAMESAEQMSRSANQNSLFGDDIVEQVALVEVPRWSEKEKLLNEKASLGFYFSGHLFDAYGPELAGFSKTRLKDLTPQQQPVLMAGIIYATRTQMTRRGKMAFVALDDGTAQVEVAIFSELFDTHRDWLKEDQLLILEGKVSRDDYSGGFRINAERLYDLAAARTRFARSVRLFLNGQASAGKLMELLSPYRAPVVRPPEGAGRNGLSRREPAAETGCPVTIAYRNGAACCEMELGEGWRIRLHDNLLQSLTSWLSEDGVRILYR